MKRRATGSLLIAGGVLSGLIAVTARAEEGPLLVVVEAPPELAVDAGEIRRAIGAELHDATVAPARPVADTSERALVVSVDRERITMSLRESATTPVTRAIPSPGDRTARLRAIAWLAGNLARDQVSGILAEAPDPPPPAPTQPPPAALPDLPPARAAQPVAETTPVVVARTVPTSGGPTRWTIGVAAGPGISLYETAHVLRQSIFGSWNFSRSYPDIFRADGTVWRIEARRCTEGSRVFTGLALEGTANSFAEEMVGATAFVGKAWRRGRWSFAGTLGAGIDLDESSEVGFSTTATGTTVSSYPTLRPGLYGAAGLAVSHPFVDSLDWVASIDAHVSVINEYDGYLAAMFGLRYQL